MAVILYIETNFLMTVAKGQDPQADNLLKSFPSSVQIVIPSICCMEALSTLENELKYRKRFTKELDLQITQLKRDKTSLADKSLLYNLEESKIENQSLLNDLQTRLFDTLSQIATKTEMIELTADTLQESLATPRIEKDPTDNLILSCILAHANLHPTDTKVFLSANINEFGTTEIQEVLRNYGVDKYFTHTQNFLGWLQSQSTL